MGVYTYAYTYCALFRILFIRIMCVSCVLEMCKCRLCILFIVGCFMPVPNMNVCPELLYR